MKKLLFAFILLVSVSSCGTPSLRVGSFNIWRSDLGKNEYEWSVRKYRLVNAIKDVDFDIFGAQEVDTTMIRELPILFVDASASRPAARNDESGDHTYYRGGCCGVLTKTSTGQKMFVVATHGCLSADKRVEYASIYEQIEKKYNTKGYPAFLIGDMNARPSDQASETYRTYWNDTYRELTSDKIRGPFSTYNGFNLKLDLMTDSRRIDYIYYRGATPVSYVCNDKKYDGLYASDHLPIYSDMILACEP